MEFVQARNEELAAFTATAHAKRCAERVLLPAVRRTPPDQFMIAGGYSCREQIVQATGRRVHHPAEVLQMALPADG